ncbi:AlkA N-terminal domain protein [Aeromicrobium marinum DSM 15272]|uniref:DNA-3-methyladenine glycosylase II n=1 Tax=Aeromicrobium marinum DSM 15272 TaxID=585531 RepID=E2SB14_9ACTN|nr:AlkA N-terminal domain-containing protein [Aeromicrobium marinum]EFQ83560.1 AlkA N-terminal domain protein [Aeromicrobium marinum DSM 15272]
MTSLHDARYRAVLARDARFDGVFYTGVLTTGIYCRPSCPAVTPRSGNVAFHASAAAAHEAGFRACRRCRPDTTPGSPEWDVRGDTVARAMRLIGDGVVDRDGVEGLARRLGYSTRHVHRVLVEELGAGPSALARSARAQTARLLIETTVMPMSEVAFAAGFASIRQFNDAVRIVYDRTPSELRRAATPTRVATPGRLELRLAVRQPFCADALLDYLAAHVAPGLESVDGRTYARVVDLPHGRGVVALTVHPDRVDCRLELDDLRDTATAVHRSRQLLDLDADPVAVDAALGADAVLAPLVAAEPGLRVPGAFGGFENAVRTIVGQQVSVAGACTVTGRLVRRLGHAVAGHAELTHAFPTPESILAADPTTFGMPRSRASAVVGLAEAVLRGDVDLEPGADRTHTRRQLLGLRGVGPWTADYVVMRALGDPDVLLSTDLVLQRALARRGLDLDHTDQWRPWRAYAGMHLWRASATDERPTT